MKKHIHLGVVCLARTTYDYQAAKEIYDGAKERLREIPDTTFTFVEELVIEIPDAMEAARQLQAAQVNAVVIISGTFHLGHLALLIDRELQKPVLLWAFKELPYNGGKIRLNSVCGLNLNASNLYKSGNDTFTAVMGDEIDMAWVDAIRMREALRQSHVGIAGYRAHGFFNVGIDELGAFRQTGVLLDHYELSELYSQPVSGEELKKEIAHVRGTFACGDITDTQVELVARLTASMRAFLKANALDALAIRCWPEFARDYGISPCAAMSILQDEGFILGCEGDVDGTLSMLCYKAIGVGIPFMADLSQVNLEEDFALMWHCGVYPASLCDSGCVCSLDTYFAGGKGVTADFVLGPGEVSLFRMDGARGKIRILYTEGQALPTTKENKGTYAKVRFDVPLLTLLDTVVYNGYAHHVCMAYGKYRETVRRFARVMGWDIHEPTQK